MNMVSLLQMIVFIVVTQLISILPIATALLYKKKQGSNNNSIDKKRLSPGQLGITLFIIEMVCIGIYLSAAIQYIIYGMQGTEDNYTEIAFVRIIIIIALLIFLTLMQALTIIPLVTVTKYKKTYDQYNKESEHSNALRKKLSPLAFGAIVIAVTFIVIFAMVYTVANYIGNV